MRLAPHEHEYEPSEPYERDDDVGAPGVPDVGDLPGLSLRRPERIEVAPQGERRAAYG